MRTALRRDLRRIYDAAIAAAAPGPLIARAFDGLTPGSEILPNLFEPSRRIFVLAAGKAAIPMTRELVRRCGTKLEAAVAAAPADPSIAGSDAG